MANNSNNQGIERGLTDIALALKSLDTNTVFVNGVARTLIFKSGVIGVNVVNDADNQSDLGTPIFPTAYLFGGISTLWPAAHWNFYLKGYQFSSSSSNLFLSTHFYTGATQGMSVGWWAIGY